MSVNTPVIDIDPSNLQQILSQPAPLLLYFWSEDSPHCQQLTPLVERLAREYDGQFILGKLDCDNQQAIAAQFGLQAVPTLYLFQQGQPVDGLQGPQSEEAIRAMLEKVLPTPAELKAEAAAALMQQGKMAEALPLLREAWQLSLQASEFGLLLAEALIALQRSDEAETILKIIPLQDQDTRYRGLLAQIDLLRQAADSPEIRHLQQQLAASPQQSQLAATLALQLHQVGRNEEALELLLNYLKVDIDAADGQLRKMLQEILAALGTGDALAGKYRRQLYSLLY